MTRARNLVALGAAILVVGCNAADGEYAPGCIAYAGNNVRLTDGRFTWDRFTDQIEIGDDGKPVDPFPDFPKGGSYTVEGNKVVMTTDDGESLDAMYLQQIDGQVRLLSEQQNGTWAADGDLDDCALVRQVDE